MSLFCSVVSPPAGPDRLHFEQQVFLDRAGVSSSPAGGDLLQQRRQVADLIEHGGQELVSILNAQRRFERPNHPDVKEKQEPSNRMTHFLHVVAKFGRLH